MSDSAAMSPPPPPTLCPEDGRRTPTELYLKLVFANLTTLLHYYRHFLSARDGPSTHATPCYCHAVYLLLGPLVLVARYAVGLVGIAGFAIVRLARGSLIGRDRAPPPPPSSSVLKKKGNDNNDSPERRALRCLLGRMRPGGHAPLLPGVGRGGTSSGGGGRWPGVATGRVVVDVVFLTRCIGSLYLYDRRVRHHGDAVLPIDRRVLATACAGLVLGLLGLAQTLELSLFRDFVPALLGGGNIRDTSSKDDDNDDGGESPTALDRFALICRGNCARDLRIIDLGQDSQGKELDPHPHYMFFFANALLQFLALAATLDGFILDAHRRMYDALAPLWWWAAVWVAVFVLLLLVEFLDRPGPWFGGGGGGGEPTEQQQRGTTRTRTTAPWLPAVVMMVCPFLGLFIMYVFLAVCAAVCHWTAFYVVDLSLGDAMAANATSPCPQLWADPMAKWVWWLA